MNEKFLWLLFIFIFAFPKCGTDIFGIPFYIGIVFVGLYIVFSIKHYKPTFLIDILPFAAFIILISNILINKRIIEERDINFILGFIVSPILLNIFYNKKYDLKKVARMIIICGSVPVIYGILQLIFGIKNTVIPGITFNFAQWTENRDDLIRFMADKCNLVKGNLKLFSTYQNGNIYGLFLIGYYSIVSYWKFEKNRYLSFFIKSLVIISIFRTLSRTAIFAFAVIILIKFVYELFYCKNKKIIYDYFLTTGVTIVLLVLLSILAKENIYQPIIDRIFNNSSQEILTGNERISKEKFFGINIISLIFGNPLFGHESLYINTLFSLGIIAGLFFFINLFYIDYLLFKNINKISIAEQKGVVLAFFSLQIAGILDIAWGLFPIEVQFWILFELCIYVLKLVNVEFLRIPFIKRR